MRSSGYSGVRVAVVALGGLVSLPLRAGAEVGLTEAFTSRKDGGAEVRYLPKIGEHYRLTARFRVFGTAPSEVRLLFEMAGHSREITLPGSPLGQRERTVDFGRLPLDGTIPYRVEVVTGRRTGDGEGMPAVRPVVFTQDRRPPVGRPVGPGGRPGRPTVRGTITGTFEPRAPARAIEYFERRTLRGSQAAQVDVPSGQSVTRIAAMMGQPASDSWQKLVSSSARVNATLADGGGLVEAVGPQALSQTRFWPLFFWSRDGVPFRQFTMKQEFTVEVSNARVNAALLRRASWRDVDALQGIHVFRHYTRADPVTESDSPAIAQFVREALGADHRRRLTPYDAARRVFQAVLARVEYTYPNEGEEDKRGHTALEVLNGRLGDCGGFSLLIVAALRHLGLPARVALGFPGGGGSHAWGEVLIPDAGWVLFDGSDGNGHSETGEFAYAFGNMNGLNNLLAVMRGNVHEAGGFQRQWLPYLRLWGPQGEELEGTFYERRWATWKQDADQLETPRAAAAGLRCPCARRAGIDLGRALGRRMVRTPR